MNDIPVAPLELDDACTCWRDYVDGGCPIHGWQPKMPDEYEGECRITLIERVPTKILPSRCIDYEQRFGQITEHSRQCRAYGTDCPDCGATLCSEHMRVHDCPESIAAVAVTVFREMLEAHNQFMLDNLFGIRKAGHA